VFAQFPLGASKQEIIDYFGQNISYAGVQEYKTSNGTDALNFTKIRVVGDYTFYFNDNDECTSYVETYDKKDVNEVIWRFDRKLCRINATNWSDEDNTFSVTLLDHPKKGANFIAIVYRPAVTVDMQQNSTTTTLAAN
jgi:hypothetical protein